MSKITPEEKIGAVFNAFDEVMLRDYGLKFVDAEITDSLVHEVTTMASLSLGVGNDVVRERSVKNWLTNTKRFSPYVDTIALERALNFEWDAIDNLTYTEHSVFVERTAAHDDPYGEKATMKAGGNQWATYEAKESPRRMAFKRGTLTQRAAVTAAVRAYNRAQRTGQMA